MLVGQGIVVIYILPELLLVKMDVALLDNVVGKRRRGEFGSGAPPRRTGRHGAAH